MSGEKLGELYTYVTMLLVHVDWFSSWWHWGSPEECSTEKVSHASPAYGWNGEENA